MDARVIVLCPLARNALKTITVNVQIAMLDIMLDQTPTLASGVHLKAVSSVIL